MGEQYKIIEYSLIILFIVTGSVFVITGVISVYLAIIRNIWFVKEDCTYNNKFQRVNLSRFIIGIPKKMAFIDKLKGYYYINPII